VQLRGDRTELHLEVWEVVLGEELSAVRYLPLLAVSIPNCINFFAARRSFYLFNRSNWTFVTSHRPALFDSYDLPAPAAAWSCSPLAGFRISTSLAFHSPSLPCSAVTRTSVPITGASSGLERRSAAGTASS
jgi:hypothetical protein